MGHAILQWVLDPRVLLGLGIAFFGGIVGYAEITQRHELAKKRREQSEEDNTRGDD